MSGRIFEQLHLVAGPGNNMAFAHNHRADGNLFRLVSLDGLAQCLAHKIMIALEVDDGLVGHGWFCAMPSGDLLSMFCVPEAPIGLHDSSSNHSFRPSERQSQWA